MLPRVAPSPSPAAAAAVGQLSVAGSLWVPPQGTLSSAAGSAALSCRAAAKGKEVLSGVMFQPFEELKGELSLVPQGKDQSLARHKFVDECEAALNEQIK
jgi:ferritin heavy chain